MCLFTGTILRGGMLSGVVCSWSYTGCRLWGNLIYMFVNCRWLACIRSWLCRGGSIVFMPCSSDGRRSHGEKNSPAQKTDLLLLCRGDLLVSGGFFFFFPLRFSSRESISKKEINSQISSFFFFLGKSNLVFIFKLIYFWLNLTLARKKEKFKSLLSLKFYRMSIFVFYMFFTILILLGNFDVFTSSQIPELFTLTTRCTSVHLLATL